MVRAWTAGQGCLRPEPELLTTHPRSVSKKLGNERWRGKKTLDPAFPACGPWALPLMQAQTFIGERSRGWPRARLFYLRCLILSPTCFWNLHYFSRLVHRETEAQRRQNILSRTTQLVSSSSLPIAGLELLIIILFLLLLLMEPGIVS